jgi:hypothetical protein
MIEGLSIRIIREIKAPTNPEKKSLFIFKCWNTLRAICENERFIPKYLMLIDHQLLPLLSLLETPVLTDFEDDIIEILISTTNMSKTLAPNLGKTISLFPQICKKFEGRATQLLIAYNTILEFSPAVFANSAFVDDMINIAITAFSSRPTPKEMDDIFFTEGAMIAHLVIHVNWE